MQTMNSEIKKIVDRMKQAQGKLQKAVKGQAWLDEARKYAEKQGKEVKKLLSSDAGKVKIFLEKQRKELERFQKQIPTEVNKFRTFVQGQTKELEKLLSNARKIDFKKGIRNGMKTKKKKAKVGSSKRKSTEKSSSHSAT